MGKTRENDIQVAPARTMTSCFAITPNDDEDLALATVRVLITVAGDLKALFLDDAEPQTLTNLAAGEYAWGLKRVWSTGTTVTIFGLR
jgi:hypothetical protein